MRNVHIKRTRLFVFTCICGGGLALAACHDQEKAEQAAKKEDAKVEARAKQMATQMAADLEAKRQADEAARAAENDKAERARIAQSPKDYFETSGLKIVDKLDGKHVRTVDRITITNKTKYPIAQVEARVDFMKEGAAVASLPLRLKGSLPAGGTRTFTVTDSSLDGAAVQTESTDAQATVTKVYIDQPELAPVANALKTQ